MLATLYCVFCSAFQSFPYPSKFQKYGLAVSRSAEDSGVLRSCQLEALHAIRATRMQEQKEKLVVVMPTGVGKSPVILLAPYFLESRNVLVIAPDTTIRDQVCPRLQHTACSLADSFVPAFQVCH